ncbi:MAG: CpsB/CapC family capsule biosynthesis tyrosine phosphatase [Bacteroidota bacterium]
MFSFFKKKEQESEYEPLNTDIHSHLLPGIDDGAATIEDSLILLRGFIDMGFRKVITTPHVLEGFPNTPEIIKAKLAEVQAAAKAANLDIQIGAAAEYFFDETFVRKVMKGEELLTFGDNYLLFETAFLNEPINLKDMIKEMIWKGFKPVMAHPERYTWLANNKEKLKQYHETGVLFQVNVMAFAGFYDEAAKKTAEWLTDNEMVSFLGSDCHKVKHQEGYKTAMKTKHFKKAMELPLLNRWL